MIATYVNKLRYLGMRELNLRNSRAGGLHFRPADKNTPPPSFDQYAAHSPMQISRHKADELKSKLFFQNPPIPNRIPKFTLLFFYVTVLSTGFRDKLRRRNKK
jgi:hypothetical protein